MSRTTHQLLRRGTRKKDSNESTADIQNEKWRNNEKNHVVCISIHKLFNCWIADTRPFKSDTLIRISRNTRGLPNLILVSFVFSKNRR